MLIYGSNSTILATKLLHSTSCPSCDTHGTVTLTVYAKYAHVFWIPTFPLGLSGIATCSHCKHVMEPKEMSESIKREYLILKGDSKSPLWCFSGLGLIAILIAVAIFVSNRNNKEELTYIENPSSGDVYTLKINSAEYTTLKVMEVSEDSVFVQANEYAIDGRSQIYKIDKPENYLDDVYGLSRVRLKEMHTSDEIVNVDR